MLTPIELNPSPIKPTSKPIHVDIIASPATGAAVASITKASLSLDIYILSVTGLIIGPIINEFA